jgi:hypothetical protein
MPPEQTKVAAKWPADRQCKVLAEARAQRFVLEPFSQSTHAPRVVEKSRAGAGRRVTAHCTAGHAFTHSAAVSLADRLPEVNAKRSRRAALQAAD